MTEQFFPGEEVEIVNIKTGKIYHSPHGRAFVFEYPRFSVYDYTRLIPMRYESFRYGSGEIGYHEGDCHSYYSYEHVKIHNGVYYVRKVIKEIPYDPTQQGDTDDDI